jgi:hypothetical protein
MLRPEPQTWPVAAAAHEACLDWIAEHVKDLLGEVVVGNESNGTIGFGGKEIFPPAERAILGFGYQFVNALEELGQSSVGVGEDRVPVIGEHTKGVEPHARRGDGVGEAVEEDVVGAA